MSLIVASLQLCSSTSIDTNLTQIQSLISQAKSQNASLIVLPENMALMAKSKAESMQVWEEYGKGKIQSFLSEQARANRVWIVGGTIPICCAQPDKVRSACIVFDDNGEMVARYDKMHLFDVVLPGGEIYAESDTFEAGEDVVVIDTPFGRMGIAICYDLRFPELFRAMFAKGAEFFVVPSAFTAKTGEAHWEVLLRARAIENFCYVVGACQGGRHENGRETFGNSMIVEPWGGVVARCGRGEVGVVVGELDLGKVKVAREMMPIEKHRVLF